MKIPKTVKVAGHDYKVSFSPVSSIDGGRACGETHLRNLTIKISSDHERSQQELIFLHELLHLCFYYQGLKNHFDDKNEEFIVDSISCTLYDILKTNKMLAQ